MATSSPKTWTADLLEAAPSVLFLLLWRLTDNLELAGWIGGALALAMLLGFRLYRIAPDTIFLGINIYIAIITPLIISLYRLGTMQTARNIETHSYPAVLITIFLTGCLLTLYSRAGFVGSTRLPRRYSQLMLAASAAAILWGFSMPGNGFITVGLPIIALFILRRTLLQRDA